MQLISVVIPCYNSGDTLKRTIASVKSQTWPSVEIIVVDDGSTDCFTQEVLAALNDVTLVRQTNCGLPAARNAGFRTAKGDYVLPLDADDWLDPQALEMMFLALQSAQGFGYAYCDVRLEGEASGVLQKHFNFFEQLSLNQLPYCLLMPKQLWLKVGGYDETMRQGYEDWEFNIRLGVLGYFGLRVPHPLFHYRVSSNGMLISKSNRLHGVLWAQIQTRHQLTYQWRTLIGLWRKWSDKPSRYPLAIHMAWLVAHRLLPAEVFSWIFQRQRRRSAARRASL